MSIRDQARSVTQKLSNLSTKTGSTYQNIATEFLIERLIVRLTSNKSLYAALVFKGGYVGLRV